MYHYCFNAPSKCLSPFKLLSPRQRSYWFWVETSPAVQRIFSLKWLIHGWTKAGSSTCSERTTHYMCRLPFPGCAAEPEGERSPAGKDLFFLSVKGLERHAASILHQTLRAMITELVSRWQPHLENKEREMLVIRSSLLVPCTALIYETCKSLDTYCFITSLLIRKEQQKKSPNTQDPFTTYFCKTRNQINLSCIKGSFELLRIRLPNH